MCAHFDGRRLPDMEGDIHGLCRPVVRAPGAIRRRITDTHILEAALDAPLDKLLGWTSTLGCERSIHAGFKKL